MSEFDNPTDPSASWQREHVRRYVESNGADGHVWQGVPTLLLTTLGERTGKARRTALIYGQDGDSWLVVASKGGAREHPQWYRNLLAHPEARVQVGGDTFTARARTATPEEKAALWRKMAGIWPAYDEYQKKTDRDIPVVVLEPAADQR